MNGAAHAVPWRFALSSSLLTFGLALGGCALQGWHAPHPLTIAFIFVVGMGLGAHVANDYAERLAPTSMTKLLRAKTAGLVPIAIIFALTTALVGSFIMAMAIAQVRDLFLASILGSLVMATYPFHTLLWYRLIERNLEVGIDGVLVAGRVISFREIRAVSHHGRTVLIERVDGTDPASHDVASVEVASALVSKISERRKAAATTLPQLARDGRPLEAWKRDLRSNDYRTRVITSDEAIHVLRSGMVSAEERVGAALALAASDNEEHRGLVRVAAQECVDPNVRVALSRALDDSLDEETMATLAIGDRRT